MIYPTRLRQLLVPPLVLLLATGCGDGESSKDVIDGSGGTLSSCTSEADACDDGFECDDSGDEVTCVDIDECAEGTDDCDDDFYCVNNEGSFSCESCPAGHELDGSECVDIDECDEGTDSCDEHATCKDTDGSYDCTCDDGFTGDGEECSDIDECAEGTDDCDDDFYCVNNEGSFSCESCPAGHELDGSECVDIDECATDTDSCDEHASCENTDGSHECSCDEGFGGDGRECADIDECEEGLDDCDSESYCVNNEGAFSCEPCAAGYELDGNACVALVPDVIASSPMQGAVDVYPSKYFPQPGYGSSGKVSLERVDVQLIFDLEMDIDEATVVVTDEAGLEEPRTIEGTWDETGRVLSVVIWPHNYESNSTPALQDETTYDVSFAELKSSYGTPVDPEDAEYPEALLTFTTGVRNGLINHACGHVNHGPFATIGAGPDPASTFSTFDSPHTHYTINLPSAEAGEPHVGYAYFIPAQTQSYFFFLRDPGSLQFEYATVDQETFVPNDFVLGTIEEVAPACHTITPVVDDPETGGPTFGTPMAGITHVVRVEMDENEAYMARFTSEDSVTYTIVESASSF